MRNQRTDRPTWPQPHTHEPPPTAHRVAIGMAIDKATSRAHAHAHARAQVRGVGAWHVFVLWFLWISHASMPMAMSHACMDACMPAAMSVVRCVPRRRTYVYFIHVVLVRSVRFGWGGGLKGCHRTNKPTNQRRVATKGWRGWRGWRVEEVEGLGSRVRGQHMLPIRCPVSPCPYLSSLPRSHAHLLTCPRNTWARSHDLRVRDVRCDGHVGASGGLVDELRL